MYHFIFFALPLFASAQFNITSHSAHVGKRQAYFTCGVYPNQFLSSTPCNSSSNVCANNGRYLGIGCFFDFQCTPYSGGVPSSCVGRACCTTTNAGGITKSFLALACIISVVLSFSL